jgi:hypothetical protein
MRMNGRNSGLLPAWMLGFLMLAGSTVAQEIAEPSTLRATINQGRVSAGQSVLAADAVLDEAAQMAAQEGSNADQVRAFLLGRRYATMQLDVLIGTGNASALAVGLSWQTDPAAKRSLENSGFEEIGTAAAANPKATGPGDAYRWVAILAKPLRVQRPENAGRKR